ncbi:hypothetical protein [Fodinibacter luteus]
MPTNPYPRVEIGHGLVADLLTELSDADLLAYLRWSDWQWLHSDQSGFTRWGFSKLCSSARREWVGRSHDASALPHR